MKGFTPKWMDPKADKGNVIALQLVVGGMMMQPCNPTMLQARDAILRADTAYYNDAHKCEIWKGFAKRGIYRGVIHNLTGLRFWHRRTF